MTRRVSISDANGPFTEYVEHVVATGDHYLFTDDGKTVAELAPVSQSKTLKDLPDLLRSMPRLPRAEAEEFAATIAEVISQQAPVSQNGPWE